MERHMKILVVEDDPVIRFSSVRLLRSEGYFVEEAETGAGCLCMINESRPDLVLLDIMLPDMDGYEVCRKIKLDQGMNGVYVLMVSGNRITSDDQSKGLEIGADGYIVRPISNRELLARIQAMVRIIEAEQERDRLIVELQESLARVKTLSGLLPICANCKNIRDDKGYWTKVETYIRKHSTADFSHSICPACLQKLYPNYQSEENEEQ